MDQSEDDAVKAAEKEGMEKRSKVIETRLIELEKQYEDPIERVSVVQT